MKTIILLLPFLLLGCDPPDATPQADQLSCAHACRPNNPLRVARTLGKFECECDVLTDGGIVQDGSRCGGRAVRKVSATAFGEDVECAR